MDLHKCLQGSACRNSRGPLAPKPYILIPTYSGELLQRRLCRPHQPGGLQRCTFPLSARLLRRRGVGGSISCCCCRRRRRCRRGPGAGARRHHPGGCGRDRGRGGLGGGGGGGGSGRRWRGLADFRVVHGFKI